MEVMLTLSLFAHCCCCPKTGFLDVEKPFSSSRIYINNRYWPKVVRQVVTKTKLNHPDIYNLLNTHDLTSKWPPIQDLKNLLVVLHFSHQIPPFTRVNLQNFRTLSSLNIMQPSQ